MAEERTVEDKGNLEDIDKRIAEDMVRDAGYIAEQKDDGNGGNYEARVNQSPSAAALALATIIFLGTFEE
ncbi:unnamed protein product [Sphagnum balticum]